MNATIDLSEKQVIPAEGYLKPNGEKVTVQIMADVASTFAPQASLTPEVEASWDTMQANETDVSVSFASGVSCVRTFEVDSNINMRFSIAASSGEVTYVIS